MSDKEHILIVEDEAALAKQLKWGLSDTYNVAVATDADHALDLLKKVRPLVTLLDLGLPPHPDTAEEGLKLMKEILMSAAATKIIVMTGNTNRGTALEAVSLGAYDYYSKPVNIGELKTILNRAMHISKLEGELTNLKRIVTDDVYLEGMIATSQGMIELIDRAKKVASTDYPVLIQGESGTGKERLAQVIHHLSQRSDKPLVIINCGAIPENLLESELFGHEKGSFTGAYTRHIGKLEVAAEGTVVLDEIGELPLALQVKLLRFLQEGTIERVGGSMVIDIDARVIAITNVDLEDAVEKGLFREDLYYRLNVVSFKVPPLRQRPEDIPVLARYFLDLYGREVGRRFKGFSPPALDSITSYVWDGNIREMQNKIRRAVVMAEATTISPADLGFDSAYGECENLKSIRDQAEIKAIKQALIKYNYNISKAAIALEISRPTLHDLIKKHNITVDSRKNSRSAV